MISDFFEKMKSIFEYLIKYNLMDKKKNIKGRSLAIVAVNEIKIYKKNIEMLVKHSGCYFPSFLKAGLVLNEKHMGIYEFHVDSNHNFWILRKENISWLNRDSNLSIEITESNLKKYIILEKLNSKNGYVREKTLNKQEFLSYLSDSEIMKALLDRLNDWVLPVRLSASKSLLEYIKLSKIEFIVRQLPSIYHLQNCLRGDHLKFIEEVELYLIKHHDVLVSFLNEGGKVSRYCFILVEKYKVLSREEVLKLIDSFKDIIVLKQVSNYVVQLDIMGFKKLEPRLLKCKNTDVRRAMFRLYIKFNIDKHSKIMAALFDKTTSMAEDAWWYSKNNDIDAVKIYRETLLDHKDVDVTKIKHALKMVSYLKLDAFSNIIENIIFSSDNLEVKRSGIKSMVKIDRLNAINLLIRMCVYGNAKEAELASLFLVKLCIKYTTNNSTELYNNILSANSSLGKKVLIQLIPFIREDWEQLKICLMLYDQMNNIEYNELGVMEQLLKISILFRRLDSYELVVRNWIKMHPGSLNYELCEIFKKTYHGGKFLEEMVIELKPIQEN